jgi:hypothetical protein
VGQRERHRTGTRRSERETEREKDGRNILNERRETEVEKTREKEGEIHRRGDKERLMAILQCVPSYIRPDETNSSEPGRLLAVTHLMLLS